MIAVPGMGETWVPVWGRISANNSILVATNSHRFFLIRRKWTTLPLEVGFPDLSNSNSTLMAIFLVHTAVKNQQYGFMRSRIPSSEE
ncbi:hypothetical protein KIN20_011645 [Parelaphostrongylus tenuis]|uniref:Uncharacterized protein n=1 Tax=Parelaphostrongylus tenuis TaxID=148309 RepID=A0AAD5MD71_PARTN|nr:hypothetical protein KIN20_011645 [Parelaphostrongylus tenuis]